ncbi:MAG: hypothetical protein AABX79_02070 [Nanoarchaeota archaeon]
MKKTYTYAPNPFQKMPKRIKKLSVANAVYIVDRDIRGKKITSQEFKERVKEVENKFISLFGGVTNDEINHGEFLSKVNHKIITERVARIMSFVEVPIFKKHRKALEEWLLQKKKEWNQEVIAYEFEGDLYYI